MSDKTFEKMAIKYPLLFQKAKLHDLDVTAGWEHIIDVMCSMIVGPAERTQRVIAFENNKPKPNSDYVAELEKELAVLVEQLPILTHIKEKFGGLRIYSTGGQPEHQNYMRFAEVLSYRTCEECGSPGEPRNSGVMRTLCERHHKAQEAKDSLRTGRRFDPSKLSD